MLSKAMVKTDSQEARELFNRALEMCLLLALPAAVALAVIPREIISVLFERGAFGADDTAVTAQVLMAYALGLPAYVAIKVFSTAHWSRQDTVTPVRISIIATVVNIALSLVLIQFIGVVGIALGTGVTAWLQFYMHVRALRGHPAAVFDARFRAAIVKIIGSTVLMAVVLYGLSQVLGGGLWVLVVLVVSGLVVYGAGIFGSGVLSVSELKRLLVRK